MAHLAPKKNSKIKFNELFYSFHEGILFTVIGYADYTNCVELIECLNDNGRAFASLANAEFKDIHSDVVTKSSRYKHMRYFWVKTGELPEGTMVLGQGQKALDPNTWSMRKWLEN